MAGTQQGLWDFIVFIRAAPVPLQELVKDHRFSLQMRDAGAVLSGHTWPQHWVTSTKFVLCGNVDGLFKVDFRSQALRIIV